MSLPKTPGPAKLIIGIFMKDKRLFPDVTEKLVMRFGGIDMVSPWFAFDFTDYYESEMGTPLFRRILVFKTLIQQEAMAGIKLTTNAIERDDLNKNGRRVNIDPGYLLRERFVLATGKNFAHRIFIGEGIYAELTLIYQKGAFKKLPWTYPDYGSESILSYLMKVRDKYVDDLKRR